MRKRSYLKTGRITKKRNCRRRRKDSKRTMYVEATSDEIIKKILQDQEALQKETKDGRGG